jgi:hypothetical protein
MKMAEQVRDKGPLADICDDCDESWSLKWNFSIKRLKKDGITLQGLNDCF